jgi:hypothetical protein
MHCAQRHPATALFPAIDVSLKTADRLVPFNADSLVPRVVGALKKRFADLGGMTDWRYSRSTRTAKTAWSMKRDTSWATKRSTQWSSGRCASPTLVSTLPRPATGWPDGFEPDFSLSTSD